MFETVWRNKFWRLAQQPFIGLRGRLLLLLLVAAVPVLMVAGSMAWQNYRGVVDATIRRAELTRTATLARHRSIIAGTLHFLQGVGALPALRMASADICDTILAQALTLVPTRVDNLAMFDAAGGLRCSARPTAGSVLAPPGGLGSVPWFKAALADARPVIRAVPRANDQEQAQLLVVAPLADRGVVVACVTVDWLTEPMRTAQLTGGAWLIAQAKDDGLADPDWALALDRAAPGSLPRDRQWASGARGQTVAFAGLGQNGQYYAYAAADLSGGMRLLVAEPAGSEIAQARNVLLVRLVVLAMLLAAGLAGVALGAHYVVVEPIKRLSLAVRRWQGGAPFDPGSQLGFPREVADLSASFARATTALAERERQLRTAVAQQELLMQEIHHRVKNNLQIVASLLNLQASRIRQPEAKREFQSARDRIRALATLHRHLYAHGDLHTINMRSFLNELCGPLLDAMGDGGSGRIQMTIEASELQLTSDQAVPIALIVTEAVSNAAKFAFPDGRAGHVAVRLTTADAQARLIIEDDGIGLPPGQADSESGRRDGIGRQLISGFARQLGASLEIVQHGGTRYELTLPLYRQPDARAAMGAPSPA